MAPIGWATPEEREFLRSFLPEYEACQVKRKYKAFWQHLNADYFSKFPMLERTFPGRKLTELTQEERDLYSSVTSRQEQVQILAVSFTRFADSPSMNSGLRSGFDGR